MINYIEKYNSQLYYVIAFGCFGLFIFQRIPYCHLSIGTATPTLLVPVVIMVACFLREWTGFLIGLFCGIALDTVMSGSSCFNTITLMFIGLAAGLVFRLLLNRNIKAAAIAGALGSAIYYLLKWLFFDLFAGDSSAIALLLRYHLPSAIYTAVFTVPLFFIVKKLTEKYVVSQ